MSRSRDRHLRARNVRHLATLAAALLAVATALAQPAAGPSFPGIGRAATPKELAAWDIDVRPDFKGLPKGSGSVAKGMEVWEGKCASCHGIFGESNEVFSPLIGGTTKDDVTTGRVARLLDRAFPARTTLMKVATVSTLWDYINRAMPWTAPKSLSTEEVYAVTAYLLNLGGVVPEDFTLSDRNIAEVQQRLPNRDGMTTDHGLWPGRSLGHGGHADVRAEACMTNCVTEPRVASVLPDFARNAHGNLAEQNRLVGAQHGADTTRPPGATAAAPAAQPVADAAVAPAVRLAQTHKCLTCHAMDRKIVGPAFDDVAKKYQDRADAAGYLATKIRSGGSGVWGAAPMPAQTLPEADARTLAQWLAEGGRR